VYAAQCRLPSPSPGSKRRVGEQERKKTRKEERWTADRKIYQPLCDFAAWPQITRPPVATPAATRCGCILTLLCTRCHRCAPFSGASAGKDRRLCGGCRTGSFRVRSKQREPIAAARNATMSDHRSQTARDQRIHDGVAATRIFPRETIKVPKFGINVPADGRKMDRILRDSKDRARARARPRSLAQLIPQTHVSSEVR